MIGYADLHLHTVASDGTQTLSTLIARAKAHGLSCIAITDHDVISSELVNRVGVYGGVEVITGVEVKATFGDIAGEILGYFVDPDSPGLRSMLDALKRSRVGRMRRMVDLCREHAGVEITFDEVRAIAAGNLGRPHLARILMDKGVIGSFEEAFGVWLGKGRPCYWPIDKPDYREVLDAVHDAGGVASLAHPCLMKIEDWPGFLDEPRVAGLDAIEAIYPYRASSGIGRGMSIDPRLMRTMAEQRGFLLTGGSDDHGANSPKESLGTIRLDYERVEALKAALPVPV
ncbi:PHP domain-containing protein [Candidatus Bipolaricaulota bacterium]